MKQFLHRKKTKLKTGKIFVNTPTKRPTKTKTTTLNPVKYMQKSIGYHQNLFFVINFFVQRKNSIIGNNVAYMLARNIIAQAIVIPARESVPPHKRTSNKINSQNKK